MSYAGSNNYDNLVNKCWSKGEGQFGKPFVEPAHALDLPGVLLEESICVAAKLYGGLAFTWLSKVRE